MNSLLGQFIRDRRDALKMTQTDLSKVTGVDQRTISRIENTRTEGYLPTPATLKALAKGLGMSSRELLAQAGYDTIEEELPPELSDPRVRLFASKLGDFTQEELDVLMAWIRSKERDNTVE